MNDDYEMYSEKETLEMVRSEVEKLWKLCILISLDSVGAISAQQAIDAYGCGAEKYKSVKAHFMSDRNRMMCALTR